MEIVAELAQETEIKIWNDQTKSITFRKVEELKIIIRAARVQKTPKEEDDLKKNRVDRRK
jgi:hypothetical protein